MVPCTLPLQPRTDQNMVLNFPKFSWKLLHLPPIAFYRLEKMLLLLTSLIFLLWQGAAAKLSNPVITAAPNPPTNEILGRRSIILEHERWLERKAAPSSLADGFDELGYCFGTGSICVESNALYSQCEPLEDENNDMKWFTCQCENGYFATDQE
jgi:hypothetical protein